MDSLGFSLLEGEEVIETIKPLPSLKQYFFVTGFFLWFFIFLVFSFFFVFPAIFAASLFGLGSVVFSGFVIFLIFPLAIAHIASAWSYEKSYYWITNKRIAVKRGLLGYSINSTPLERISDVIISRSFLESAFGFGSLYIQSLSGQYSYSGQGSRFGAEGVLLAVPNPEELQRKIFALVKQKREKEHLTM